LKVFKKIKKFFLNL